MDYATPEAFASGPDKIPFEELMNVSVAYPR